MQDPLLGRKLVNKHSDIGTVTEVDKAVYSETHSPENPWITITLDRDKTGFSKSVGCLNTLLREWSFLG